MYSPGFKNLNLDALEGAQALAYRIVTTLGCSHRCLFQVWQLYCCQRRSIAATAKTLGVSTGSVHARLNEISRRLGVPLEELRSVAPGTPARCLAAEFRARHRQFEAAQPKGVSKEWLPENSIPTEGIDRQQDARLYYSS